MDIFTCIPDTKVAQSTQSLQGTAIQPKRDEGSDPSGLIHASPFDFRFALLTTEPERTFREFFPPGKALRALFAIRTFSSIVFSLSHYGLSSISNILSFHDCCFK